ncbi:MAG: tetraacyldisaccharide 4'-kinase [Sterolibacterium sp.]|jgi:tetraacyldisaccharide 4'-kinase|nr:tetraacyldisaccharide 4'-kinase [Sterolibacterium sp.]
MLERLLPRLWQRRGLWAVLLLPLSAIFWLVSGVRRAAYVCGVCRSERLPVPLVVIGNIIVGGSGKTPLTLWLADALRRAGRHPGVISRGYAAAETGAAVREVLDDSLAAEVGDEPLLLKRRSGLPVFVGRDRVATGRALLAAYPECDLILSDDGLQHYRLLRDVEIALVDARGMMNGWLLPSGPLREWPQRLTRVHALVLNGEAAAIPEVIHPEKVPVFRMRLSGAEFTRLHHSAADLPCTAAQLGGLRLAAVCGIAVPERFFAHLECLGLQFTRHAFADHHAYTAADLAAIQAQTGADALLMTEKDAVKCGDYSGCPVWVLPVTADVVPDTAGIGLVALVEQCLVENSIGSSVA